MLGAVVPRRVSPRRWTILSAAKLVTVSGASSRARPSRWAGPARRRGAARDARVPRPGDVDHDGALEPILAEFARRYGLPRARPRRCRDPARGPAEAARLRIRRPLASRSRSMATSDTPASTSSTTIACEPTSSSSTDGRCCDSPGTSSSTDPTIVADDPCAGPGRRCRRRPPVPSRSLSTFGRDAVQNSTKNGGQGEAVSRRSPAKSVAVDATWLRGAVSFAMRWSPARIGGYFGGSSSEQQVGSTSTSAS